MIKGIEHTAIMVSDMDRSLEFYEQVLGMTLRHREWLNEDVELAFLYYPKQQSSLSEAEIELVYEKGVDVHQLGEGLVNHLAFRVEDISETMGQLRELGIVFDEEEPIRVLGNVKIAFFSGPDGEILELVER
ncbi:VOC family protein [Bacillus horti]|uniref:Aldoketomutase n=1 Tax=Caldalkalibacillus horti TaxID=77523 RepID=A0ABT9VZG6_9BACI|nr:VOC family protein [Bacillus horti]MDQ0166387.1 lactoylglutathione lyase [Bacillus horti]